MDARQAELRDAALPTLVMLPGLDGTGRLFEPLLDTLGCRHRVVAYEAEAPTTYDGLVPWVTQHLPTSRPYVLLAESFSGPVATSLAAARPPGLEALVLCNSFVRSPAPPGARWLPWRYLLAPRPPDWALRRYLVGASASPELCDFVRRAVARTGARTLASRLREVFRVDVRAALRSVAVPVLDLRGRGDRIVRGRAATDVRVAGRATTPRTIDGPHLLLQARPRESAEAIRAFLDVR